MTRIRFKGFGVKPSQPRWDTPRARAMWSWRVGLSTGAHRDGTEPTLAEALPAPLLTRDRRLGRAAGPRGQVDVLEAVALLYPSKPLVAGRPFARLRAAKRAAICATPGSRLVVAAARLRHRRVSAAATSL